MYGKNETMRFIGNQNVVSDADEGTRRMIGEIISAHGTKSAMAVIDGFTLGFLIGGTYGKKLRHTENHTEI